MTQTSPIRIAVKPARNRQRPRPTCCRHNRGPPPSPPANTTTRKRQQHRPGRHHHRKAVNPQLQVRQKPVARSAAASPGCPDRGQGTPVNPSIPGCRTTSTPTNPTAIALQRRQPTLFRQKPAPLLQPPPMVSACKIAEAWETAAEGDGERRTAAPPPRTPRGSGIDGSGLRVYFHRAAGQGLGTTMPQSRQKIIRINPTGRVFAAIF